MAELAAGGLPATLGHRPLDHLVCAGLSQPERSQHRPLQQRGITRQLGRARQDHGGIANRLGTEIPLADHHQRQAVGGPADVRGARARLRGQERQRLPGGGRHRRGRAAVEAGVCGIGQDQSSELRFSRLRRQLGGSDQGRVALHHRPAIGQHLPAQVHDASRQRSRRPAGSELVKQRLRPLPGSGPPGSIRRGVQQLIGEPVVLGEAGRALEAGARRGVGAASERALGGLLQRGRHRLVRSGRGGGEMPGSPVGVTIGQGPGQGAVHLTSLGGRRVAIARGPRQRMAELDDPVAQRHQPGGLRRPQVSEVEPQRGRGAGNHRRLPIVAGSGQGQRPARTARQRSGAVQERLGDPS